MAGDTDPVPEPARTPHPVNHNYWACALEPQALNPPAALGGLRAREALRGNRRSTRSPHRSYGGASCSPATRGRPTRQPRPNAAKTKQIKLLKKKNTFWGRSLVNLPLTKHRGQQERQQRGGTRMDPWRPRGWVPVKKKEKSHDK